MTVTKQRVIAALAEQRVNRPRHLADQNIRNLLRTYGGARPTSASLRLIFISMCSVPQAPRGQCVRRFNESGSRGM
jgi:hypothetical protein